MSALGLRPRKARTKRCDWFGCDPEHGVGVKRRPGAYDVLLLGRGIVCEHHASDLVEVWRGAFPKSSIVGPASSPHGAETDRRRVAASMATCSPDRTAHGSPAVSGSDSPALPQKELIV
jgi:hypothetical protein